MGRKPMTAANDPSDNPFFAKRVTFVGKLAGANRREAARLVRKLGGTPLERDAGEADIAVVGADPIGGDLPESIDAALPDSLREARLAGRLQVVAESELWRQLGLVDEEADVRRLYTPAMLARLLSVPVATVRQWTRRKLIVPTAEVKRLQYFSFQEISVAKRLAELVANGASLDMLRRRVDELHRALPGVERPLAELGVVIQGQRVLLRHGDRLIEPNGQSRFDFDADARSVTFEELSDETPATIAFPEPVDEPRTAEEWEIFALRCEDEGRLDDAIEAYRASLAVGGLRAETCFALGDALYRQGDLGAARERLFVAVEMDRDFVEARANLGCLLSEMGEHEMALAALEGALDSHPDYADVHYHLAGLLDRLERRIEADEHWSRFLELAPDSPWAEEARDRLSV